MSCAVCQDTIVAAHNLPCGHCFCGSCLFEWLPRKQECPNCRCFPAFPVRLDSSPANFGLHVDCCTVKVGLYMQTHS